VNLRRAAVWVALVSALVYGNTLSNGFAYDDTAIVVQNPVVTEGRPLGAWRVPYWPGHSEGSGLYRPLTVSSFAMEWALFGSNPAGFHAINVATHAAVAVLVLLLLAPMVGPVPGFVGALVFAVHPLHTEAVANVVGRGELYAAALVLAALLLYRDVRPQRTIWRLARTLGIGALYFLALSAKEIAVTLPGLLLIVEATRRADRPWMRRVVSELPVIVACVGALAAYLATRYVVLGTLLGELPAPELRHLSDGQRILTAVSLWPEYIRLLVVPLRLSADYSPAVLFAARGIDTRVLMGGAILLGLLLVALRTHPVQPTVSVGIAWFALAILPVSQVLFPTGVLLAERTFYLPSVGLSLVVAGLWAEVTELRARRSKAVAPTPAWRFGTAEVVLAVVLLGLAGRTWTRNPTWMSSFTVFQALASDHPESSLALRSRGTGLVRAGEIEQGRAVYEAAIKLAPDNYSLLTEVGHFYNEQGSWEDGERVLTQAIRVAPTRPGAYRLLASQYLLRQRYREGHRVAVDGLNRAGADAELFALVSESYVAKPDLAAAIRARQAALGQAPYSVRDFLRLAELHEMSGDSAAAAGARIKALAAEGKQPTRPRFTPTGRVAQEGSS